jgi:hypothetical protein
MSSRSTMRAQNAPAPAAAAPAQAQAAQPHRPKKYDGIDGPLYESNYSGHYGLSIPFGNGSAGLTVD